MKKNNLLLFLIGSLFVFSVSCHVFVRPKGESLKQSWQRYWTYLKQKKFKKAFYYEHLSLSPGRTPEDYAANIGLKVKNFEFIEIGKEGSGPMGSTPIKMRLVTNWPPLLNIKGHNNRVILDYWIKKGGQWYHLIPGLTGYW